MRFRGSLKSGIRHALERAGYAVIRQSALDEALRHRHDLRLMSQLEGLMLTHVVPDVPVTPGRPKLLSELLGTNPIDAMLMLDAFHRALHVAGDIVEFGVAQGATSALLANELLSHAPERTLWLYDSFEGLPEPTEQDVLVDDVLGLGSMDAYKGHFSVPRQQVESRLAAAGWPGNRTRIVSGYFTSATPASDLPSHAAFAYIDFDLYQPTNDALEAVHSRSTVGSIVVVDDYGFFSSGAQKATDELVAAHASWTIHALPEYAGAIAILEHR